MAERSSRRLQQRGVIKAPVNHPTPEPKPSQVTEVSEPHQPPTKTQETPPQPQPVTAPAEEVVDEILEALHDEKSKEKKSTRKKSTRGGARNTITARMPAQVCKKFLTIRVHRHDQYQNLGNGNSMQKKDIWAIILQELRSDDSEVNDDLWLIGDDETLQGTLHLKLSNKWTYARDVAKTSIAKVFCDLLARCILLFAFFSF